MAAALDEVRKLLPAEHKSKKLRLMEVWRSKVFKVFDSEDEVARIDDSYWTLRVEAVLDDEEGAVPAGGLSGSSGASSDKAGAGSGDLLVMVCHVAPDRQEQQQQQQQQQQQLSNSGGAAGGKGREKAGGGGAKDAKQQPDSDKAAPAAAVAVIPFGEPFLMRIGRDEALSSVKERIRARLEVKADAFAKWRFCYVAAGRNVPEYLSDGDAPAQCFASPAAGHTLGNEVAFLGCEHEDKGAKRPSGHRAGYGFERAVKINS